MSGFQKTYPEGVVPIKMKQIHNWEAKLLGTGSIKESYHKIKLK